MGEAAGVSNPWIAWTAAALMASLFHVLVDFHIGLYGGASSAMSLLQAANIVLTSLVFGWWIWATAVGVSGNESALVGALVVAALWAFLWNGVVGLFVSPPPSSAFPYQDIAHLTSIVFGAGAAVEIWRVARPIELGVSWTVPVLSVAVLMAAFVVQSVLGLQNA